MHKEWSPCLDKGRKRVQNGTNADFERKSYVVPTEDPQLLIKPPRPRLLYRSLFGVCEFVRLSDWLRYTGRGTVVSKHISWVVGFAENSLMTGTLFLTMLEVRTRFEHPWAITYPWPAPEHNPFPGEGTLLQDFL